MAESMHESIYVATSKTTKAVVPQYMVWRNRTYEFLHLGLHHTTFDGDTLIHMFSLSTSQANFQISLNTKTLLWRLEKVESL